MVEIIQEVKGGKVVKAIRVQTQRNDVKAASLPVLLEFENVMPKRVRSGYLSCDVRKFIPAPLHCLKCQRTGQTAGRHAGKLRCGGEDEFGKCVKDVKTRCCNCGGEIMLLTEDGLFKGKPEKCGNIKLQTRYPLLRQSKW